MNDSIIYPYIIDRYIKLKYFPINSLINLINSSEETPSYLPDDICQNGEDWVISLLFIRWFIEMANGENTIEDIIDCMNKMQSVPLNPPIGERIKKYLSIASETLFRLTLSTEQSFFKYLTSIVGKPFNL